MTKQLTSNANTSLWGEGGPPVVLFDGVCNLCSRSVQFIINHDKKKLFYFASLQSEIGQQLLKQHHLSTTNLDSFVLLQNGKAYKKSTGALKVAKQLSGSIKFLYGLIILPAFLRDAVYTYIGNNRYKWFGKKEECWLPTSELKQRFLDLPQTNEARSQVVTPSS